jgi:hypothetical protein
VPEWRVEVMYQSVRLYHLFRHDSTRDVCRQRALAGLFRGDYTSVDPRTVPRPLWPKGILPY